MSYISAALAPDNSGQVWVWERTPQGRVMERYKAPLYYYYPDVDGQHESIYGKKLSKHEFKKIFEYYSFSKQCKTEAQAGRTPETYELLLAPELKILSQHYHGKPAPDLTVIYWDIEIDSNPLVGYASPNDPTDPITSVALRRKGSGKTKIIAVPPKSGRTSSSPDAEVIIVPNEVELLKLFIEEIKEADLLASWNGEAFDLPYIAGRLQRNFGEDALKFLNFPMAPMPRWGERRTRWGTNKTVNVTGRIMCDMMLLFKKFEQYPRSSYKLDNVAEESFDDFKKIEYEGSLHDLYHNEFDKFIQYNARDVDILEKLEEMYGFIGLANDIYHLSCGQFASILGTVKLASLAIINYCHYEKKQVCPDHYLDGEDSGGQIEGAHVLEIKRGAHEWFGFVDIKSLYPSVIQSINISPETLVGQCVNTTKDFELIRQKSIQQVSVLLDNTKEPLIKTGIEWASWLQENKCAISGYGTIYSQATVGILPAIIGDWRKKRIHYQKLKKQAEKKAQAIRDKYQPASC